MYSMNNFLDLMVLPNDTNDLLPIYTIFKYGLVLYLAS